MATPIITPVTPVPRIALPNPHLRKPSLSSTVAQADSARNSTIEDIPVPAIPKQHQHQYGDSLSVEIEIGQAVTSYSPIDAPPHFPSPSTAAQKYTPATSAKPKASSPPTKSNDSGYHSTAPTSGKSPVVPIRSMFPVYNPQVTLGQQQYYPQRPGPVRSSSLLSKEIRPGSAAGWTPIDRTHSSPSSPPTFTSLPLDTLTPCVSTAKELNNLWEATHGMEPNPRIRSYDLELARYVLSL